MKSNYDYLKETLTDEQMEFLDGLVSEHKEALQDKDNDIEELKSEIDNLKQEMDSMYSADHLFEIDFGCGKLQYLYPENLRVQNFMDTLKQRFHGHTMD